MRFKVLATALLTVIALASASVAVTAQDDTQTGAPGKVVNLQVSATSDSVTVSWSAPENGGAADRYRVNLKAVDAKRGKNKNVSASKTTATFRGQSPDTEYRVRVRAINDAGRSARVTATVTTQADAAVFFGGQADPEPCVPSVDVTTLSAQTNNTFYLLPTDYVVDADDAYHLTPEETCNAFGTRTAFIGGRYNLSAGWHAWLPGKGPGGSSFVLLEVHQLTG